MKKFSTIILAFILFTGLSFAADLPLDFEQSPENYAITDFDGGALTVIENPQSSGINTSAGVAQMVKNDGQSWAGSFITLDNPIDFSANKTFKMKVFAPAVGTKVLLKVENLDDSSIAFEKEVETTVANEWEELTFDYNGINTENSYQKVVLIFDNGTVGDGSADFTYLLDDLKLANESSGLEQVDLPVDFESSSVDYTLTDFGGNSSELGEDPTDASNAVAVTTKTAGAETWAGTTIGNELGFKSVIPFTEENTSVSVMLYSPEAGLPVRLKVEDHADNTLTAETQVNTTVANEWEELVFDFSNVAEGTNPFSLETDFDKMSIFFNFGAEGSDKVFYWDEVKMAVATSLTSVKSENINVYVQNETLFVKAGEELINCMVEVYELSGRKIWSKTINNQLESLNINSKGIFIVRVSDANQASVKATKVIIR